jgi:hypothetical protein
VAPGAFGRQFFEQQSPAPTVQESASDLQPFPPGSAAHAFAVDPTATGSHSPVQHSLPEAQDAPRCRQEVPAQVPEPVSQESEQHSPEEAQLPPVGLQNAAVAQVAAPAGPVQKAEQQSAPLVQGAPLWPQETVGEAHTPAPPEPSQKPEQQSFPAAQASESCLHTFDGSVQTPLAHAFVQQSALPVQAWPAGQQVAEPTHTLPAQPSPSPAQQSPGTVHAPDRCEQAGTWQVRVAPPDGQTSPMQQSPSVRQGALAEPQLGGGTQVPEVHESDALQHGTDAEQPPFVAAQVAGGTQVAGAVPAPSGSTHESAPLQQGTVPVQGPPVAAQVAGAVQTLPVQASAALQQGTEGGEHVAPVPAQVAGAVQTLLPGAPAQAPPKRLQQSASTVQEDPVPAQVAGSVQTLLPAAPAQAPAKLVQQSASTVQEDPVPWHVAGTAQRLPAQTSVAEQHGSVAQDPPAFAQVAAVVGAWLDPPLHDARTREAPSAKARAENVGRAERNMSSSPGDRP